MTPLSIGALSLIVMHLVQIRRSALLPPHQLEKIYLIRRGLAGHKPMEAIERLLGLMGRFPSNAQMLLDLKPML